jgi:hypothetical protein
MDPRFMWQHVFGVIVLSIKTGRNEEIISKKSFLIYALSKYDSVDLDDFISDDGDAHEEEEDDIQEELGLVADDAESEDVAADSLRDEDDEDLEDYDDEEEEDDIEAALRDYNK